MIISEGNSMVTTKFSEFLLASNNTWNSVSCVKYAMLDKHPTSLS